jgi:hypothetical protein
LRYRDQTSDVEHRAAARGVNFDFQALGIIYGNSQTPSFVMPIQENHPFGM